jgi:predicted GH43/DUF377 family glycosyl hydrolase
MKLNRLQANPLLTPADLAPTRDDVQVLCTLNPAAVRFGEETLLLVRVGESAANDEQTVAALYFDAERGTPAVRRIRRDDPDLVITDSRGYYLKGKMLLTSLSHLRIARSRDGVHFTFDPTPAIFPSTPYEAYGCEDARITQIGQTYYITYTAVSELGVTVALATTSDFRTFERQGIIFPPYQKDVYLFPEQVGGMYVCRHRPYKNEFNDASIWTAYSPDLLCWGKHARTLAPTPGTWEGGRVGGGAPPIKTDAGWLEIYHAADEQGTYRLAVMLSELDRPEKLIARSKPILQPEQPYELHGVYANCVFSNGLVVSDDGQMTVYYGGGDKICAAATGSVADLIEAALQNA